MAASRTPTTEWLEDIAKLLLRLLLAGTMLFHGIAKVTNPAAIEYIQAGLTERGVPGFIAYGVFIGELVAPAFLVIGLFTRAAAALVTVTMIFALWLVHSADLFAVTDHGIWAIELQMYFLVTSIVIALIGGGRLAIFKGDGLLN